MSGDLSAPAADVCNGERPHGDGVHAVPRAVEEVPPVRGVPLGERWLATAPVGGASAWSSGSGGPTVAPALEDSSPVGYNMQVPLVRATHGAFDPLRQG